MRASCSMVWLRFLQTTAAPHSVTDSPTQTATFTAARTRSWPQRSSMPVRSATKESSSCTTTSTAKPIRISGKTSKILLAIVRTVAQIDPAAVAVGVAPESAERVVRLHGCTLPHKVGYPPPLCGLTADLLRPSTPPGRKRLRKVVLPSDDP